MADRYDVTEDWLAKLNGKFSENDIPHEQRPWLAWMEWSRSTGLSVSRDDRNVEKIFDWFEVNTRAGSQYFGPMFVGSFYFDSCFWPIFIPVVFGRVQVNAFNSLRTVPYQTKKRLTSNKDAILHYIALWADCLDYAYSIDELSNSQRLSAYCRELLRSGDNELNATITLLHAERPNAKSIESARMSVEMFLKAFLAAKIGLTDAQARKEFRHDLHKTMDKCVEVLDHPELKLIRDDLAIFPPIEDRYKGVKRTPIDLWAGYSIAQYTGATVGRLLSGRDVRPAIR
jgi:hypothetical protein